MRSNGYEHLSPNTGRWSACNARNPDFCPFMERGGKKSHRPIGEADNRATLLADFKEKQATVLRKTVPSKPIFPRGMPAGIVYDADRLNERFSFANQVKGGYEPTKHMPVKNLSTEDLSWTKPGGGLWLSTVGEDNRTTWDDLWGYDGDANDENTVASHGVAKSDRVDVTFKPDAKVLVIDSLDDYRAILDRYPHKPDFDPEQVRERAAFGFLVSGMSAINADGTVRRGMDFEALAKDYDAVMLSSDGLWSCGRQNFYAEMDGDLSLYLWDIESCYVLNKDAIRVI